MASNGNQAQPRNDAARRAKKPQTMFGVMTKRRWFAVMVFLCSMVWAYTAGPPLADAVISNRYFKDGNFYDYSTIKFEGDLELIDRIFRRGFWPDVFTWQIGAFFNWTEGPIYIKHEKYEKLLFSDTIMNKIFSWSPIYGVQIVLDNSGQIKENNPINSKYVEPGSNGLLLHPTNPDIIFIAQHRGRIVSYNMQTKQTKVIASKYDGKRLNSPNDLVLGPNKKYIYFTDPPYGYLEKKRNICISKHEKAYVDKISKIGFSGVYRVSIDGEKKSIELLDKSVHRPNGIVFSNNFKELFVSNCIEGEFNIHVFKFDSKKGEITLSKKLTEKDVFKNVKKLPTLISKINGGVGCVDGMAIHPFGYLIATCPGAKLCIINEKTKELEAVIKLPDKLKISNVAIAEDEHLYITGNHTVWQLKLQPFKQ